MANARQFSQIEGYCRQGTNVATPVSWRRQVRKSLEQIGDLLAPHPQALDEITRATTAGR
jgi:hypothetical protein